ncbi:MAG TPA: MATE family efflux transporter [Gemmataceae bacterium]|nr:MATE family efflux transporter [Gemmataceae bacterium]
MTWKKHWYQEAGALELLRLAIPLILSSSFLTLQLFVDRVLLSQSSHEAIAASMPAAAVYWTAIMFLQYTANYATTFVAQYVGAGRPERVGPSVWQSLYFSVLGGLGFFALLPLAEPLFRMIGHAAAVQEQEILYLRCLCFAALPALIVASVNSFFAGRGETWIVAVIDATGMTINAVLAYALIFGHWGLPEMGIRGAGWATVIGSAVSALLGLALFFQAKYRARFGTLSGWRFDPELFRRMMRFGLPNGVQAMLDGLSFTVFLSLLGRIGEDQLAASNIAFAINIVGLLPMLGMGQAVGVVVGQRLGQDRPDLATRSTWMGFWMALVYISAGVLLYVLAPGACMYFFRNERDPNWAHVAELVPVLLRFVAVYSLFDTMNIVFSFALRGAGDTRFVTIVSLFLAWPIMVLPTWAAWKFGWGLYWAWGFASAYVIALGITFLLRFQAGKWKSMRVIERTRPGMSVDGQVLGQTGQEQKSEVPPANNASILEATN